MVVMAMVMVIIYMDRISEMRGKKENGISKDKS